jgi:hypothetical protein
MGFVWDRTPTDVFNAMYAAQVRSIRNGVETLAQAYAPNIENWMKDNAPWTDQTGNLRQSLHAEVEVEPTRVSILFDYGLDYGKYLEYGNAGTYAIVAPTMDHFAPQVFNSLQELFR